MLCNEEEFEAWSPQFSEEGVLWNCTMTIRYVKLKTKILKKNIWEYVDFSNAMPNGWLKYFGNQGNLERMVNCVVGTLNKIICNCSVNNINHIIKLFPFISLMISLYHVSMANLLQPISKRNDV